MKRRCFDPILKYLKLIKEPTLNLEEFPILWGSYKTFYSARKLGLDAPKALPNLRVNLYKSFCRPTLYYATECLNLSDTEVKKFNQLKQR